MWGSEARYNNIWIANVQFVNVGLAQARPNYAIKNCNCYKQTVFKDNYLGICTYNNILCKQVCTTGSYIVVTGYYCRVLIVTCS